LSSTVDVDQAIAIDVAATALADDEHGGGLFAARIAAGPVGGVGPGEADDVMATAARARGMSSYGPCRRTWPYRAEEPADGLIEGSLLMRLMLILRHHEHQNHCFSG